MNPHIEILINHLEQEDDWQKTIISSHYVCLLFENQPPRLFNLHTGLEFPKLISTPVTDAAFRPGHWQITFALGRGSHELPTYCLQTGFKLKDHQLWHACFVAYSPDGQWLAAADQSRMVLWHMDQKPMIRRSWSLEYTICGLDFDWEDDCLLVDTTQGVILRSYLPGWNFPR
jgi:hypothetical protein